MPSIKIKRGTRAQLTSTAAANGLKQGELYHVTDEDRVDLGTAVGASVALAKKSEVDGKAAASHSHAISDVSGLQTALDGKQPTLPYKITVSTTEPSSPAAGDIWISY
jgi:hypothetical protein